MAAVCEICGLEFLAYKTLLVHNNLVHEITEEPTNDKKDPGLVKEERNEIQNQVKTEATDNAALSQNFVGAFEEVQEFDDKSIIKRFIQRALQDKNLSEDHCYSQKVMDFPNLTNEDEVEDNSQSRQVPKKKIFFCKLCNKEFENRATFTEHKIDAHSRHQCNECGKSYASRKGLSMHKAIAHKELKINAHSRHQCGECGKSYASQASLWKHKSRAHKGNRFSCQFCTKNYAEKKSLDKHLQSHISTIYSVST